MLPLNWASIVSHQQAVDNAMSLWRLRGQCVQDVSTSETKFARNTNGARALWDVSDDEYTLSAPPYPLGNGGHYGIYITFVFCKVHSNITIIVYSIQLFGDYTL